MYQVVYKISNSKKKRKDFFVNKKLKNSSILFKVFELRNKLLYYLESFFFVLHNTVLFKENDFLVSKPEYNVI